MEALCEAREFSEIRWQANERDLFRDINKDPFIVCPIEGAVHSVAHKISMLIQMELGRVEVTNISGFERQRLHAETSRVLDVMHRLIRTVIECKGSDADGTACWAALELARSMTAKAWENRPMQLLQVPQLGPAMMRKLVSHNIRTVSELANSDPGNIERIVSRNPPFGKKMVDSIAFFPRLTLSMSIKDRKIELDGSPMVHVDGLLGFTNARGKWQGKFPIVTFLAVTTGGTAAFFCRESLNAFDQHRNTQQIHFTWTPEVHQEALVCRLACEEIVGTIVSTEVHHGFPSSAFTSQIKDNQLPSDESRRSVSPQFSPTCDEIEDEVDDDDMLGVLNDPICEGDSNKGNKTEADPGDDDLFTMCDDNSNDEPPPMPQQGQSISSSRAVQQKVDKKDKGEQPRTHKSKGRKDPSQICDNDPIGDEPVRLANGRYKCGHPCSQIRGGTTVRGHKCGHDCCRNGSKYPPKKPNISGKRKERNDQEVKPGAHPVPASSFSTSTTKRPRKDNDPSRKLKASGPSVAASGLDLSLCDVDEGGIIDLTGDDETEINALRHVEPPKTVKTDNNRRTPAASNTNILGVLLDDLCDDDMDMDIDMAFEAPHTRGCTQTLDQNNDGAGLSDGMSSSTPLDKMPDQVRHGTSSVSTEVADRTSKRDQQRVLDATRYGKSGNTRRQQTPDERKSGLSSSHVLPSDKNVVTENGRFREHPSSILTEPVVTGNKSRRHIMKTESENRKNLAAAQEGSPVQDELMAVKSKKDGEPEWVTDFDPAWISEFRGLVDFM